MNDRDAEGSVTDPRIRVNAVAKLAAFTKHNAGELDSNIISSATSLAPINSKWSAEDVVKRESQSHAQSQPAAPVHQVQGAAEPPPVSVQPIPPVPHIQQHTNMNHLDILTEINTRLKTIENKVNDIEITYDKILKNMLKSKAKQITIKFDEAQNK